MWAEVAEVDKMVGRSGTPDALDVLQRQNRRESVRRFQKQRRTNGRLVKTTKKRYYASCHYLIKISDKGDDIYKDRYKRVY